MIYNVNLSGISMKFNRRDKRNETRPYSSQVFLEKILVARGGLRGLKSDLELPHKNQPNSSQPLSGAPGKNSCS